MRLFGLSDCYDAMDLYVCINGKHVLLSRSEGWVSARVKPCDKSCVPTEIDLEVWLQKAPRKVRKDPRLLAFVEQGVPAYTVHRSFAKRSGGSETVWIGNLAITWSFCDASRLSQRDRWRDRFEICPIGENDLLWWIRDVLPSSRRLEDVAEEIRRNDDLLLSELRQRGTPDANTLDADAFRQFLLNLL
ncbi:hypothetical protein COV06_01975 [Candidatus Uhrbacteria bacterium CG10_big_fil_rev_8_21_14_0_10_50_16]|uniref:Uncharacterized protein n=1 Tax=Candidatus Uhrbacteria bacterium CG10_big_fil_rev_8_21_14_0_10_50_16 TaxID=1975039 RepID=A0A2H0RMP5_9BACT|nr:MAG: hypothetical protein COV06_01975 [Candidatus Uhrbacteria bacterium CG10_big_fil_rev_8_21_14_0_10_50_16]